MPVRSPSIRTGPGCSPSSGCRRPPCARADDDAARLLTLLTTLDGGLPQGAPTSPGLSNFVNRELDARLAARAAVAGARYTRYCDDLAFSWPAGWGPPSGFERNVRAAL